MRRREKLSNPDKPFFVKEIDRYAIVGRNPLWRSLIEVKPPVRLEGTAFMRAVLGANPPEGIICEGVITTSESTIFYVEDSTYPSSNGNPNLTIIKDRIDKALNEQVTIATMMLEKPFEAS